jgi:hypothetical protein
LRVENIGIVHHTPGERGEVERERREEEQKRQEGSQCEARAAGARYGRRNGGEPGRLPLPGGEREYTGCAVRMRATM